MLRSVKQFGIVFGLLAGFSMAAPAWAHAFPVKSSPQVGATEASAPKQVRIWFDADLNALFSKITVESGAGQVVNTGGSQVPASNPRLLETNLKPLAPGQYWVQWSVVARDGHHTEGKFPFNVK
ncbi:hypothetical protein BI364_14925 [Acidihalobacter yilgarnensis]|uniref:Copper resistance protein C n=1 Tax=Acidihalobacter yilgarnensis TaxID=2819280 RepID=A0A1D8IRE0_9GAMM|nr:copper resistance CopC family protein [Acidihalobacter yilgarnensis]AOU99061.1 hypothetical protein BI364_14925 [Acidihalobacter yilgarnensis]